MPFPDWDLFNIEQYFESSSLFAASSANRFNRILPVSTSRGCVHQCTFCYHSFYNQPFRSRSTKNIVAEIRRNLDLYGVNHINFWDNLTFSSIKHANLLIDAILESGLKFTWDATIRADLFGNPKWSYQERFNLAEKFRVAGCERVSFSLESGNARILQMMNKRITADYFLEQVKILDRVGIISMTSVIFGYPIETKETIKETFAVCLKSGVYPSIGFLLPLPHTPMYDYAKSHGYIVDDDDYLSTITERQDLVLNMTTLNDHEFIKCVIDEAENINIKLNKGLERGSLIKTNGFGQRSKLALNGGSSSISDEVVAAN